MPLPSNIRDPSLLAVFAFTVFSFLPACFSVSSISKNRALSGAWASLMVRLNLERNVLKLPTDTRFMSICYGF